MHQANPWAASANLNPNEEAMEWTECSRIAMWVVHVASWTVKKWGGGVWKGIIALGTTMDIYTKIHLKNRKVRTWVLSFFSTVWPQSPRNQTHNLSKYRRATPLPWCTRRLYQILWFNGIIRPLVPFLAHIFLSVVQISLSHDESIVLCFMMARD